MPRQRRHTVGLARAVVAMVVVFAAGCDSSDGASSAPADDRADATARTSATPTSPGGGPLSGRAEPSPDPTDVGRPRPDWLGTRLLPLRPDGFGEVVPTPPELVDRRFDSVEHLPPPRDQAFDATVEPVPDTVLARSTWRPECPVGRDELRYLTVAFWGFDEQPHTGELLVHQRAADDLVRVFERLFDARFPIEEMRVVAAPELDAHPTGDGNNTTAFVCRPVTGAQRTWSQHAYGLAIDINPFHNPYVRDDLVLPELASVYTDRDDVRPGMIVAGDVVTAAFAEIGWGWGGAWDRPVDPQHFSHNGR